MSYLRDTEKRANFNPRPRKEGDGVHPKMYTMNSYFNPRPRKEGDWDLRLSI